jgi:hypothetical protein
LCKILEAHFLSLAPTTHTDGKKIQQNGRKFKVNRIEHGHHVKSPCEETFSPRTTRSDWREAHEPKKSASREEFQSAISHSSHLVIIISIILVSTNKLLSFLHHQLSSGSGVFRSKSEYFDKVYKARPCPNSRGSRGLVTLARSICESSVETTILILAATRRGLVNVNTAVQV